jgi:RHS repeat-associated protein
VVAEYTAFGETFFDEHINAFQSPYLFNAKEKDAETGLYYYGARYYDPRTSVWISVDPMVDKYAALSPYNYCLVNPVRYTDPGGEAPYYDAARMLLSIGMLHIETAQALGEALAPEVILKDAASTAMDFVPFFSSGKENNSTYSYNGQSGLSARELYTSITRWRN